MFRRPRHPKPDGNQAAIIADAERHGMYVWDLSALGGEVLDLVIGWRGVLLPFEVKKPGEEASTTDDQCEAMVQLWSRGIPAFVVTNIEDVVTAFEWYDMTISRHGYIPGQISEMEAQHWAQEIVRRKAR